MAEETQPVIYWTERAIQDSLTIKKFLLNKFTEKEVDDFFRLLQTFENLVKFFPELYQISSKNNNIRKAVLSK